MVDIVHPATLFSFDALLAGLMVCVDRGSVKITRSDSLALFNYTPECSFDHMWDQFSMMARGLILDMDEKRIVATPFLKFFNASEREGAEHVRFDEPFDAFTKMDGSLGIVYHYRDEWHVATRGSFSSPQAQWAKRWLHDNVALGHLDPDLTYLCEIIYDDNRIVIRYPYEGLVLLGAYNRLSGEELPWEYLLALSEVTDMRIALRHYFPSFGEAQEFVKTLPGDQEGFVIRFRKTGQRVKLKGTEYCTLHKMISGITPLGIWELVSTGHDMDAYKKAMPEELWPEIDGISDHFSKELDSIIHRVTELALAWESRSDKEVGLAMHGGELKGVLGSEYLFTYRKKGLAAVRAQALKNLRPTGNVIEGYVPSALLHRVQNSSSEG